MAFGTSGHRGTSLSHSFNEDHILAISQAICEYRASQGTTGPLFVGMDTHALSEPALMTALEVFAANGVDVHDPGGRRLHPDAGHLPCHPDATTAGAAAGLADGVVITPSHNPPSDGGFKYNPPNGGPADTGATRVIQDRANALIRGGLTGVKRIPFERARQAETTHEYDYITPYVAGLT